MKSIAVFKEEVTNSGFCGWSQMRMETKNVVAFVQHHFILISGFID